MNTNPPIAPLLTLILFSTFTLCQAEEKKENPPVKPPDEAELRAVITKGLGYLEKGGQAWMTSKKCNGCHHIPEMIWSHREARKRGFPVDPTKFNEWLKWAVEKAPDIKPGIDQAALMILAMPDRPAPELIKLLVSNQKPDGSWKTAGQFAKLQRRGASDAKINSIRLILMALATPQPTSPEADAARAKAQGLLEKAPPATSMESLAYEALYNQRFGKAEEGIALRDQIIKEQRGDGGWSSYLGANKSDPLATGQALYALQSLPHNPSSSDAISRGQNWLVETQLDEGRWPIDLSHISKKDRSGPKETESLNTVTEIYDYWGSSWATIGLLQGVPATD